MQVDIDFDIFQKLTLLRRDESDSYSDVIRRLLAPPESQKNARNALSGVLNDQLVENALGVLAKTPTTQRNALADYGSGAWFDNTHFPEGTKFRARYKGELHQAEIQNGSWVGDDGVKRTSPSAAASSISNTNVNGWRFWSVKRPQDDEWQLMDALRS